MSLVLALIFALLVAVFAIQNASPVPVRFLGWNFPEISLVLVILGSAVLGALSVGLLGLFKQVKMSMKIWDYQQKLGKLENENKGLQEKGSKLEEEVIRLKAENEKLQELRGKPADQGSAH